ncbi:MAG: FkbM family methyltransferase, partial [Planctomycetota bacterium]
KKSCELFPIALYKEESVVELEISADNRGDHRIRSKQEGGASSNLDDKVPLIVMVPARPLDEVVPAEGIKEIIAIKCDTQGAEVGIYLGGQKIISKAKALLMEFWPHGLNLMESDPEEIFDKLIQDFDQGLLVHGDERIEVSKFIPIETLIQRLRTFFKDCETSEHVDFIAVKADLLEKLGKD